MIDPLESRRLLSATFHANTGNLDVDGTGGDDVITFAKVNTSKGTRLHVTINGTTDSFNAAKIKVIKVTADDGNDSVTIGTIGIPSTVDGGAGDDALFGGDNRDKLIGGDGNDSLSGAAGNDTLIGGDGIDSSNGGDGDDLIIPDNGSNADDIIIGGAGNDTVDYSGSTIPVVLVLGAEPKATDVNDFIPADIETVIGSEFNDRITDATTVPHAIFGGPGNDKLIGNGDGETLDGGDGKDTLVAGEGGNTTGRNVSNVLTGDSGKDLLIAGASTDSLSGGSGDDRFLPDPNVADTTAGGGDTIDGGSGNDTLDDTGSITGVTVVIGGAAGASAESISQVETVLGSDFADNITDSTSHPIDIDGNGGNDTITGGSGNDTLNGGPGHDSIVGGDGNDLIEAKDGKADTINASSGTDTLRADDYVGIDIVTRSILTVG